MFGCSKAESREAAPAPKPVAPTPAVAEPAIPAPSLVPGTRVDWPVGSGGWVAVANRGGVLHVVVSDADGVMRDVSNSLFEDEYIEVDDSFQMTKSGDKLIVARSMHKMTEAYREVFLLAPDPIRVAERWSGLEGQSAPFEAPSPALPADSVAWAHGPITATISLATKGTKARLVALDGGSRSADIPGGAFTMDYDADSITLAYEVIGDRLVARMSTAENVANNCERLLVAAPASAKATPRVIERWRGECSARAPFEPAE